jgi:DNA-binding NtrC family response regulator
VAASFHPPPESLAGEPAATSTLIVHAGGQRIWRRLEFWPFRDEHAALIGLFGVVRSEGDPHTTPDSVANSLHVELLEVRRQLDRQVGFDSLLGLGAAHRRLLEQVRLAASSTVPVLLLGEPGTGKRHVARVIHQNGPGRLQPLVSFDSEALPAEVLDRELFAAAAVDSPTFDASSARVTGRPRLALAEGSTVLIREIFMLPRDLQARLAASLDSSVRLIGTSVVDPESALASARVRPDLYFAMTTLVIRMRPLRERREELPILAQHLLERANQRGGKQKPGFTPEALAEISGYDWPGNLHELTRVIDHAHASSRSGQAWVEANDLPGSIRANLGGAYLPPQAAVQIKPLDQLLAEVEQRSIEVALRQARGNKSRAADLLGISRPRLYRRIKELNLPDEGDATDESHQEP